MEQQTETPVPPPADLASAEYGAEIRFGVVMYGGVSLAIYINGVSNELFEMACATPRAGVVLERQREARTRALYRRLSWLVGNEALRQRYAERIAAEARRAAAAGDAPADVWDDAWVDPRQDGAAASYAQTRLVVDVVAGASAGGINGIFLAKALANGEQFSPLRDMWINEGDIGLLLNDKRSYRSTQPPLADRSAAPASLLNSDRMYHKLADAMQAMTLQPLRVLARAPGQVGSPLVEEIDLFVTTTDIAGSAVPLRLFDKVVYERRYKQNYRFSYPNGVTQQAALPGNDFDPGNNAFLAFAARCTSSFPFAFEPMTLAAVERLKAAGPAPGVMRWKQFFPNLPREEVEQGLHKYRAFGDGGYLDNKPFTYVVETLSQRFASVPLERKLVYVEPSPEHLDPRRMPDPEQQPDALSNSLAALSSIPRYETIREDLQAILQRNRRIERVERMVRLGELDIDRNDPLAALHRDGRAPPGWGTLKVSEIVHIYGLAFLPYLRLRVYATTDALADRLGARWGVDRDSDQQYALRALVRVWRERHYDDEGTQGRATISAFLDQFDLDYRLRRLGYLLRKLDQLTRLMRKRSAGPLDLRPAAVGRPAALSEVELQILAKLPGPFTMLPDSLPAEQVLAGIGVLGPIKVGLVAVRAELLQSRRRSDLRAEAEAGLTPHMQRDLATILDMILGKAPQHPSVDAAAGETRIDVVLNEETLKLASVSRTLQESVLFRARAVLDAADAQQRTPLQQALESGLQSMRVKRRPAAATAAATAATTMAAALAPTAAAPQRDADVDADAQPELERINARASALLGMPELYAAQGEPLRAKVAAVSPSMAELGVAGDKLAQLNSAAGHELRAYLGKQYRRFDMFDQMSFPLYYDTATGEPATVEVVRISPPDATSLINEATDPLHRHKLAGTAFGNFGAFLDQRWRLNDNMWGRLDGAERLIEALLPTGDDDAAVVRAELIQRAHLGILREALVPDGEQDVAELVVTALAGVQSDGGVAQRLRELLSAAGVGDAAQRDRLTAMLGAMLSDVKLMDYVRQKRVVDPNPEPKTMLDSLARATTITGRVLQGISAQRGAGTATSRWIARTGLMLQGLVAVSLPGALTQRWWSHGMKVLYSFELVALAMALLLGSGAMRTLALTALLVTLGFHLLSMLLGDYVRQRHVWLRASAGLLAALTLAAALVGAAAVYCRLQPQRDCAATALAAGGAVCQACDWLGRRPRGAAPPAPD